MPEIKIGRQLLLKVAENARLKLSEREIKKFLLDMKDILQAFSKIDEADTNGTEPSFHPVPLKNVFRNDERQKCLKPEDALSNTKHRKGNYFLGPKVV